MPPLVKRKNHPFRFLLLGAGAILVVALAAAIVIMAALNPERLRADLQDAVKRQTGRDLTIAGGAHLSIGLSPQFELRDVSLANITGGSRPHMLTARSVRARLALLPLLGGDAVVSALIIDNADLLVERTPDGAPNWQFAPEHRPLFASHAASGERSSSSHRVEIRSLALNGGKATWQSPGNAPVVFDIGRLLVTARDADSPMTLAFDGARAGAPVTLNASLGSLQRLQGGPVSALAGAWPVTVDVAAQDATMHIEGGITHPDQGRGYRIRVNLVAPSLDKLNTLLSRAILPPLSGVTAAALLTDGSQGELRSSQVSIHAGAADLSQWVPNLNLKSAYVSAPGPGQLMQLNVDGTYQDQPLRATATANQPDVIGAPGPVQVTINVQAAGGTLSAHGTVPPGLNASGLDMTVNLQAPDLAALSPLAGRALPPARDVLVDAQVGDAGVKLRGVMLRSLAVTSSLGDVSGQASLAWSPRLTVTGTLTSHMLNLDALLPGIVPNTLPAIWPPNTNQSDPVQPLVVQPPAPPVASATATAGTAMPVLDQGWLPLARLRTTDADLALSVGDLVAEGTHVSDVQAHLRLTNGKLALNPFRGETAQGIIDGGFSIDASSDIPPVALTIRSPSIAAEAVANGLGYPGGATGTMQVDLQLSGVGQSVPELKSSLNGHLGLAMVNGQVEDSMVQGLIGAALNTAGVQSFGGGESQVRCFALRVDFHRGQGVVRALSADTSRLALDGDGNIDLAASTADLHLRPRVRLGPTEIASPVSLRGPFGQMRAAPDPVMGGGRYGLTIGSAPAGPSNCVGKLALARGGLGGPVPTTIANPADTLPLVIRKPKDLLQGLFH